MKILIVGASGTIGSFVVGALAERHEIVKASVSPTPTSNRSRARSLDRCCTCCRARMTSDCIKQLMSDNAVVLRHLSPAQAKQAERHARVVERASLP